MEIESILLIAILIRIISNPLSNVFQKQLTVHQHPFFVNFISYGILSIVSLFLIYDYTLEKLPADFWIFSILGGICGALGNGFLVKALELGQLSVLGPINAYKSVVGIFFAFILLGEIPNLWAFLGVALIIIGSYFVLNNEGGKFSWALLKQEAIKFRLLALVLTGTQAVFDKQVILNSNLTLAFASWCIFGAMFSVPVLSLMKVNYKLEMSKIRFNSMVKYLALSMSVAIMVFTTNYTFSKMQVGPSLALFQVSILISVFFGYRFFKETDLVRKIIGSLIMILGSVLIILLN
jgi:uncharacterized membrane protein